MTRAFQLGDLVARFGGHLIGDARRQVHGFATLQDATPERLAFLANPRYRNQVAGSVAGAVLLRAEDATFVQAEGKPLSCALWVCEQPYVQFARIATWLQAETATVVPAGISAGALVDATAVIDASASIGPGCVVGAAARIGARVRLAAGCVIGAEVEIGDDTLVYPRVVIYDQCVLGARNVVHAGAVIGADGFGFARDGAAWVKIPQTGRVLIGDDVEIGANTTIDRGALADTVIGNGVKLDNQIQIGHNVRIGDHCAMAACVGIAGSAVVGARCTVGGGAIILGHLSIADDVHVSAASVVTRSLHKPGQYTDFYPLSDNKAWEKSASALRRLPDLRERLRRLEQLNDVSGTTRNDNSHDDKP